MNCIYDLFAECKELQYIDKSILQVFFIVAFICSIVY